jgi:hypothetical protein
MCQTVTPEWIAEQRSYRHHRTSDRCVQTIQDARAFVDEVGFCHLWPIKGIEMPNLLHAIAGRARPVPAKHDDPDGSRCWGWKDQSLGKRWWYYAKLLRRKATLISLDLLPSFYACSRNFGELDDYLQEYQDGTLTSEAKQIYEALLEHGPLHTIQLRKEARMSADSAKSRFERALTELQVGLKVLPIGIAQAGAWRYAFIYEIVQRHFPDLPQQARQIRRSQARRKLVLTYIDNMVAVERDTIRRVFHVLDWAPAELDRTLANLIDQEVIFRTQVKGSESSLLVSAAAQSCSARSL